MSVEERVARLEQAQIDLKEQQDRIWLQVSNHLPTALSIIDGKMDSLITYSQGLERKTDYHYNEFKQVRRIVYGAIGAILLAVLGALLRLVLK